MTEPQAYQDPPNTWRPDAPFHSWMVLSAVAFDGTRYWFHVPAEAVPDAAPSPDLAALRGEIEELKAELRREGIAHLHTIDQRDHAEDMADRLAYTIGSIDDIGEHSNLNDPWQNALDIGVPAKPDADRLDVERLAEAIDEVERGAGNYIGMERHRWLAARVIDEYARLAQPSTATEPSKRGRTAGRLYRWRKGSDWPDPPCPSWQVDDPQQPRGWHHDGRRWRLNRDGGWWIDSSGFWRYTKPGQVGWIENQDGSWRYDEGPR